MRKKYWYYLKLGHVYDIVYSYTEIDLKKGQLNIRTTDDWVTVFKMNSDGSGTQWRTWVGDLSLTKPKGIPKSTWITIEQARREDILNELI